MHTHSHMQTCTHAVITHAFTYAFTCAYLSCRFATVKWLCYPKIWGTRLKLHLQQVTILVCICGLPAHPCCGITCCTLDSPVLLPHWTLCSPMLLPHWLLSLTATLVPLPVTISSEGPQAYITYHHLPSCHPWSTILAVLVCILPSILTHALTQAESHETHMQTHTCTHTCRLTFADMHMHSHMYSNRQTHTCTYTCRLTHAFMHRHTTTSIMQRHRVFVY